MAQANAPLPSKPDFSPQAVSRAVLRETLQRPYVLYPAAVGILGGMAALLLGPGALFVIPAALGAVVAGGAWAFDFGVRRDKVAADYVRRMQEALAGRIDQIIDTLHGDLAGLRDDDAIAQLDRLRTKFRACEDLLRRKLDPSEVTFSRYLGMTEQVFLAGLDNLRQIADTLRGVNAMDEAELKRRATALERAARLQPAQQQELAAMRDSLQLLAERRGKIDGWLAENESAMNQMDRVMAVIADLDTAQDQAAMDMQPAMQELRGLLERAHNYIQSDAPGPPPGSDKGK
jgi:hypothetical protein